MTTAREPGVVVTLGTIYRELLNVRDIATETKLHAVDIRRDVDDHTIRITTLERARWPIPSLSILVALGALATALLKS